jgi:hypothetical protein
MALRKVFFKLEPDEDGYPPVAVESVWAQEKEDGTCVIDNIPFYTREATLEDVVDVDYFDGVAYYRATRQPSENSLLRVVLYDGRDASEIRARLAELGCSTELSDVGTFFSVNVPPSVDLEDVREVLDELCRNEFGDYEESILRQ